MHRVRVFGTAVVVAGVVLGIGYLTSEAKAATVYDGLLHKASTLYVYTDSPANTQTMDISGSWWSDYQESYAKRVDQGIGWPSDFVPKFESFMATGSWAVLMQENPDGIVVSLFGTADPNAYCDFTEPTTPSPTFGCTSHAGYDYATADYFTHNSYGGNWCRGLSSIGMWVDTCSASGMNVYAAPTMGHAATDRRFWARNTSDSLNFYVMNFDVLYPDGYAGERIGTKPVPQPPPNPPPVAPCPAVKLIGVAGSGENGGPGTGRDHDRPVGLGRPVGVFDSALKALTEADFGPGSYGPHVAVDYPAAAVGFSLDANGVILVAHDVQAQLQSGEYQDSVNQGVAALKQSIAAQQSGPCSGITRIVLAGYSQGAQVIGDVLTNWKTNFPGQKKTSIANVVFFGDPKFDPSATSVTPKGTFDWSKRGILAARAPAALSGFKTISFCRLADPICQGAAYIPNPGPHSHYQEFESFWAANNVATDAEVAKGLVTKRRMSVSLSATLDPSGTKVNLDCVLRDAASLVVVNQSGATCQVQGAIILSAQGGKTQPFNSSIEDSWRFGGWQSFARQQIDISDLLNRLPACADPFGSCAAKRKVRLAASLAVAASAEGFADKKLVARGFPLSK